MNPDESPHEVEPPGSYIVSRLATSLMRIAESAYFALAVLLGVAGLVLSEEVRSFTPARGRPALPDHLRHTKPIERIDVLPPAPTRESPSDYGADELFVRTRSGEVPRGWAEAEFAWKPAEIAHHPSYFDDVPLERYGQTHDRKLQPIYSGARFLTDFIALPYKAARDKPHSRVFTHGLDAAGNDTPCVRQKWLR